MAKKYNSKQTIENILAVATKLFLEHGFEKTSIQDISKDSGLSKGAIYHHFKSKNDIIKAVLNLQEKIVESSFLSWMEEIKDLNAKEKLISILKKNLDDQDAHLFDNCIAPSKKSPEFIVSYMKDSINKRAPIFAEIIKEGIKDGSINTAYPDECAEVFFTLINIWCDPSIIESDEHKLARRLEFLQILLRNIGVDILTDELVDETKKLFTKLYFREDNNG